MNVGKLAWSNVWRNRRRSLVTMSAMSVALAALIVFTSMQAGMTKALERSVLELETGDLQIHAPGYRNKPSLYLRVEHVDELLAKLDGAGFKATARIKASGLAAGDKTSAGALLIGLDPKRDHEVSRVDGMVSKGQWLSADDPRGVVIGGRLAKTLGLHQGDDILLLGSAADGSMANEIYKIRGVLSGTGEQTDRSGVFLNASALRELMVMPEGAHQIILRRPQSLALALALKTATDIAPSLDVQTWRTLLPQIANMLDSQESTRVIMALIIFVAVGIVILNAMMMAVFERIRELGVLKAIGMQPLTVFTLVLLEGFVQTVIAILAGIALAVLPLWYVVTYGVDVASLAGVSMAGISIGTRWVGVLDRTTLMTPVILLGCVAFVAALFPAMRAARLQPIDAIHHQ